MNYGTLIAANIDTEWMMPWWIYNFRKYNSDPIAIMDLRMSPNGKARARHYGILITPKIPLNNPKFDKPFLLRQSPFKNTLWIDLDCKVRMNVEILYRYAHNPLGFAAARDDAHPHNTFFPNEQVYKSSIIAYQRDSILLKEWKDEVLYHHNYYQNQEAALSRIIYRMHNRFQEIPRLYNGHNVNTKDSSYGIIHFASDASKFHIAQESILRVQR